MVGVVGFEPTHDGGLSTAPLPVGLHPSGDSDGTRTRIARLKAWHPDRWTTESWRPRPESNRRCRCCRSVPFHLATRSTADAEVRWRSAPETCRHRVALLVCCDSPTTGTSGRTRTRIVLIRSQAPCPVRPRTCKWHRSEDSNLGFESQSLACSPLHHPGMALAAGLAPALPGS